MIVEYLINQAIKSVQFSSMIVDLLVVVRELALLFSPIINNVHKYAIQR